MKSKILLVLILALGIFMRFYKINEYMTFLGDEGRDVLVVKRMLLDGKFTLLGPITSVGSIYMGPIYYYMTAPFLYLWRFDPVGPAIMVALLSVFTIYLIYRFGSDFFDKTVGLVAAFTYSISRLAITYGHSSWNPNVVPFFAILLMYSITKVLVEKKYNFLIITGLCLGTLIQLHYVTFMFFPILLTVYLVFKPKVSFKYYLKGLVAFIAAYSPFILFELRHGFVNIQGAFRFFIQQNHTQTSQFISSWWQTMNDVVVRVFWRPLIVENAEITKLFMVLSIIIFFFLFNLISKKKESETAFRVLLIWLAVGLLSFGLYRGAIYDYYFGSLFVVPHLLFGIMFYILWQKGFKLVLLAFFVLITISNIIHSPFAIEPNNMVRNTRDISNFVLKKTNGQPYNFALIALKNSDHAYRYFLELSNDPPVVIENNQIDPERKSVTNQLLVVCEEKVCQPEGHPLWEIAGFGRAVIDGAWNVSTVKVYHLVHYQGVNANE